MAPIFIFSRELSWHSLGLAGVAVLGGVVLAGCGPMMPPQDNAMGPGGSGSVAALERLDDAGMRALEAYALARPNKAFAAAQDGSWGWQGGAANIATAEQLAMERCSAVTTAGSCRVVAWDAGGAWQTGSGDANAVAPSAGALAATPPLDDPGVAAFQTFLAAGGNKAFAVSPDGAWGWRASSELPLEEVQQQAQANCA